MSNALRKTQRGLNTDSGWLDVIGSSVAGPDVVAPSVGVPLRYRKKGDIVFINGCFGVKNKVASESKKIFTLPSGYRISDGTFYVTNTSSGTVMARFNISANGVVNLEWIRNLTDAKETTGNINWCCIDASYPV